ncbi:Glycosyltransferase involved in cell wall bisynthesis [Butyrivibrio proteoclasticus]|uniref:Glycosyltransferase involved in cell wall bisynthesis n=1 Tax=Butyrivibrio proteoclasticus TaxID=43305 RepID=A0A1I5PU07_9FIRM|nr:glycosyltransferase family 4 protein [Butyrivibrio proteoclasticus]SFP37578.1 Glycosyltransferase involved in cell wall bisynthesis [Butyrivibrio proteoclasticus]
MNIPFLTKCAPKETKSGSGNRIVQILPTIAYGDAIGNHVLALYDLLKKNNIDTAIYAKNIDPRVKHSGVKKVDDFRDDADVILYHLSTGDELNYRIKDYHARIIINYHNITPEIFFKDSNEVLRQLCATGLEQVKMLSDVPKACVCDSTFNMEDLISYGYKCPMQPIPILIAFDDYKTEQNAAVLEKYGNDDYVNIVFTGRVAPNKKQEDVISSFYYYHEYINPKSRLFIVGAYNENDHYYRALAKYVNELKLQDVYFTGHIKFDEILAYYGVADVFLCLSEHEGFCVPLVEAMYFKVPIIAYDKTAVGETLGGAGLLLKDKDPKVVAEAINMVVENDQLRQLMLKNEEIRLKDFAHDKVEAQFLQFFKEN